MGGNDLIIKALKIFEIDASEIDRRLKSGESPMFVENDIKERCRKSYQKFLKKYHPDTNPEDGLTELERHNKYLEFQSAKDVIENKFKIVIRSQIPTPPPIIRFYTFGSATTNNTIFSNFSTNTPNNLGGSPDFYKKSDFKIFNKDAHRAETVEAEIVEDDVNKDK